MKKSYDVIIIGSGPASIFAALTLAEKKITNNIAIFEKGKELNFRDKKLDILCGWGGAGAFSDGKLILSSEIGGWLNEILSSTDLSDLIKTVDDIYLSLGAPPKITYGYTEEIEDLQSKSKLAGLEFVPTKVRHLGTENCNLVLNQAKEKLNNMDIFFETPIDSFEISNGKVTGVWLKDKNSDLNLMTRVDANYVICGPGRAGAEWMREESKRIGLSSKVNPVDIGVRVEIPSDVFEDITDISHDAKFVYYSSKFDDKVRTFCVNPYGEVILEKMDGLFTVNGHSYKGKKTLNTNFAVLVSIPFTEPPFKDPITYGKHIANLANLLGNGVIIQRLGDFLDGRRSTQDRINRCITKPTLKNANPGDLSLVLPYRYMKDVIEMLEVLDKIALGVYSKNTLLYGVEVKFYTNRITVSSAMESEIENLFLIGDGAGITRGLVQASITGILAANEIERRMKS